MMTTELVGVAEICERLDVTSRTVQTWRYRAVRAFPAPAAELKIGLVWRWADVERWAASEPCLLELARARKRAKAPADEPAPKLTPEERRRRRWLRSAGLPLDTPLSPAPARPSVGVEKALAGELARALGQRP